MPGFIFCLSFLLFEVSVEAACPHGYDGFGDTCYFFSHGEESWIGALESCRVLESTLVEISDMAENSFLTNKSSTLGKKYWISLTDKLVEGEFRWEVSKQLLGPGDFADWAPGEPNARNDRQNCVLLMNDTAGYQWHDAECTSTERYICEIRNPGAVVVG